MTFVLFLSLFLPASLPACLRVSHLSPTPLPLPRPRPTRLPRWRGWREASCNLCCVRSFLLACHVAPITATRARVVMQQRLHMFYCGHSTTYVSFDAVIYYKQQHVY